MIFGVKKGWKPGIYCTFAEVTAELAGFEGAEYRQFDGENDIFDAIDYVYGNEEESARAAAADKHMSPFMESVMHEMFSNSVRVYNAYIISLFFQKKKFQLDFILFLCNNIIVLVGCT